MEDAEEFRKLTDLLLKLYPHVFEVCTRIPLPDREVLLHWKGQGDGAPTVLMAHYDVVPVTESGWVAAHPWRKHGVSGDAYTKLEEIFRAYVKNEQAV